MKLYLIGNTIYIANLAKHVTEKDLEIKFDQYGPIDSCTIVKDPITRYVQLPHLSIQLLIDSATSS